MHLLFFLIVFAAMPTTAQWLEKTNYATTDSLLANPERGWYIQEQNRVTANWLNTNRQQYGSTLLRLYVRLDPWKNGGAISDSALQSMRNTFSIARQNGYKIILRFAYNFGNDSDASLSTILSHIAQLKPLLQQEASVISVMEAGFVGYWGEWHSSTNGLTYQWNSPDSLKNYAINARNQIIDSLLSALPPPRPILIRYPKASSELLGDWSLLDASTAWRNNKRGRLGHHNDCFLASLEDWGTYTCTDWRDTACFESSPLELSWLRHNSRWMAVQGETCNLHPVYTACDSALHYLRHHRWDALHIGYHEDVINRWRQEGCFSQIGPSLGYRLEIQNSKITAVALAGQSVNLSLILHNSGFGKFYNPRPLSLILRGRQRGTELHLRSNFSTPTTDTGLSDVRFWSPGDTISLQWNAIISPTAPADTYDLHLALHDASPALQNNSRFSVRLANAGVWNIQRGENNLGIYLVVNPGQNTTPTISTYYWLQNNETVPLVAKEYTAPPFSQITERFYRINGQLFRQ